MDYFSLFFVALIGYPIVKRRIDEFKKGDSQILKIPFNGAIQNAGPKDFAPGPTTPQGLEKILDTLKKNERVKGVIFDINSGGGEAGASKTIYDHIKRFKKPKIAYVNSICASGAYMTACACDEIIVAEDALIGSLGVIMQKPNIEELMKKVGVQMEIIKSTEHKDFMSMYRPLAPEEREHLEWLIKRHHERFFELVCKSREGRIGEKTDEEFRQQLRDFGSYVTDGFDAKERGLVDTVGSMKTAVKACERMGKFKNTHVGTLVLQPPSIFSRMFSQTGYHFGKGFAEKISESVPDKNEMHYK